MTWKPRTGVANCPECLSQPKLKSWFGLSARLQCRCGVSGRSVKVRDYDHALWDTAARGWPFKLDKTAKPPTPDR